MGMKGEASELLGESMGSHSIDQAPAFRRIVPYVLKRKLLSTGRRRESPSRCCSRAAGWRFRLAP